MRAAVGLPKIPEFRLLRGKGVSSLGRHTRTMAKSVKMSIKFTAFSKLDMKRRDAVGESSLPEFTELLSKYLVYRQLAARRHVLRAIASGSLLT